MHRSRHPRLFAAPVRALVACLAAGAVLALAIFSATPATHAWLHAEHAHGHDGHSHAPRDRQHAPEHPQHVCAVTLAQQGFCDTAVALQAECAGRLLVTFLCSERSGIRWEKPEHWLRPAQGPPTRQA